MKEPSTKVLGIFTGVVSAVSYGMMSVVVHGYTATLPSTEIIFFRSIFALLLLLPFAARDARRLCTTHAFIFWLRSVCGAVSILCFTWNLQHTSVGLANVLFGISTLIVIVMAWVTGLERLRGWKIACMVAVTAGGLIFWGDKVQGGSPLVLTVGLLGAFAAAASYTALKRAAVSWSAMTLTWGISLSSVPVTLLMKRGPWVPLSHGVWIPLLTIASLCIVGQLTVALSYRWAELSTATAIACGTIAVGVGLDAAMGHGTGMRQFIGCAVYLLGCVPLAVANAKSKNSGETVNSQEIQLETRTDGV